MSAGKDKLLAADAPTLSSSNVGVAGAPSLHNSNDINPCLKLFRVNPNSLYKISDLDEINNYQPLSHNNQADAAPNHIIMLFTPTHAVLTAKKIELLENTIHNKVYAIIALIIALFSLILGLVHSVVWGFLGITCVFVVVYNLVRWRTKINDINNNVMMGLTDNNGNDNGINSNKIDYNNDVVSYYCYDINDECVKFVIYDKFGREFIDAMDHQSFGKLNNIISVNYIEASHGYNAMVEIKSKRDDNDKIATKKDVSSNDRNTASVASVNSIFGNDNNMSYQVRNTLGMDLNEFKNVIQRRINVLQRIGTQELNRKYKIMAQNGGHIPV